jgi:hypothetical protein
MSVAPVLFEGTGPGCMTGGCPEGKMTCGNPCSEDEIALTNLGQSVSSME